MAGSQLDLMPDEKMVIEAHPHWWFFWKQVAEVLVAVVFLVLATTLDGWASTFFGWLAGLALIVWLVHTVYEFLQWRTSQFAVTTRRVAYESGLFRRRGVSIPLNRVNNVNFEQSFIARLLNNGIVTIESAGESGASVFENIPDPEQVRSVIFHQIDQLDASETKRSAAAVADAVRQSSGGESSTVGQRLEELERLREQGMLTEAEYTARREAILGDL